MARSASPSASGSSVSMVATRSAAEAEPARGSARASAMVLRNPATSCRGLAAQQEAQRARAIGKGRRDRFQADLRHLVDRERQHIAPAGRRRGAPARRSARRRGLRRAAARSGLRRRPRDRSTAARAACASARRPAAARRPRRRSGRPRRIGRSRRRSARRSRRDRRPARSRRSGRDRGSGGSRRSCERECAQRSSVKVM